MSNPADFKRAMLGDSPFVLGSDADGDMYYRSGGVLARLAKGTDGQILKLASSVPTWAWGGKIVQVVNYETGSVATGSTPMPGDDTIPQKTEGDEYLNVTITPKSASNYLVILVSAWGNHSYNGVAHVQMALFQDDTAGALAASSVTMPAASQKVTLCLHYYMAAGTTSATAFKIRIGGGDAGTFTLNGSGSARQFGGVASSSITIFEVAA